jgi:hypothetical protein
MVNYYLQLFLPQPERQPVGIDEQFEYAVAKVVDLARLRTAGTAGSPVFLSSPDSFESAGYDRSAWAHPELGFHQRQD